MLSKSIARGMDFANEKNHRQDNSLLRKFAAVETVKRTRKPNNGKIPLLVTTPLIISRKFIVLLFLHLIIPDSC